MELTWTITDDDITKVKAFLDQHKHNAFLRHRIQKNVEGPRPSFARDAFWHLMMACLLTSQQKSGPSN